jgi:hypothetical protein
MGLALKLVGKFAEMHEGTDAFGEVYEPFFEIVFALSGSKVPAGVKVSMMGLVPVKQPR